MTPPLRVELVVATGGMGGAEAVALSILDHAEGRLDVSVVGLGETPFLDAARDRGIPVEVVPAGKRPLDIAIAALRVARRWRHADVDVVWANGVKPAVLAVIAGRLTGVPVVWYKHDFSFDGRLAQPLARRCAAVVATGPQVADATRREDVTVVPPPRPSRAVRHDRLVDEDLVVACVGRLLPYKGVDDVILGLPPQWHLAVIGEDDPADPGEGARLRALAASLGTEERVHFLGSIPDAGTRLGGVDVVAIPTKTNERGIGREGWSMVADEAMASGVPIVAARGGAVTDRLAHAGIAVDQGAPDQIRAALERLVDPAVRAAMGEAGREIVRSQPDAPECARAFISVLASAARRPGAGLTPTLPVSVVVPFYNEGSLVEQSLLAAAGQLREGDELVVVDDASTDGTGDALAALAANRPDTTVVRLDVNAGPAAARNAGVRAARHHVIAGTDAGCEPSPHWLDALRAAFQEANPPALLTGVYEVTTRNAFEEAAAIACYPVVERDGPLVRAYGRLFGRSFDARFSNGRSFAFTREAWESVGGLPERLRTGEDVAFGVAIADVGGRCELSVDAMVRWDQRPDLASTFRMYRRYGRGDAHARHRQMIARDLVRAAAYVVGPISLLWRWPRLAALAGGVFYLSLPAARAARRGVAPQVIFLLPAAMAVKDVGKAVGCVEGLLLHVEP